MSKFNEGDVVAKVEHDRWGRRVDRRTIKRVAKRFVELDSGEKFYSDGRDLWPRPSERFRTVFIRIELWNDADHADALAKQHRRKVRQTIVELLNVASDEALATVSEDVTRMIETLKKGMQ